MNKVTSLDSASQILIARLIERMEELEVGYVLYQATGEKLAAVCIPLGISGGEARTLTSQELKSRVIKAITPITKQKDVKK